jgi:hypothetical protein
MELLRRMLPTCLVLAGACSVTSPGAPRETSTGTPITTFTAAASSATTCPTAQAKSVLVDPTHDGGTWWYPQTADSGWDPLKTHQGRALANYLRGLGYTVRELGRGATMSQDSMMSFAVIIRAGYFYDNAHPGYSTSDLDAYKRFAGCQRSLLILSEFLENNRQDDLAAALGVKLVGAVSGTISSFAPHAITAGVSSVPFIAGSYLSGPAAGVTTLGSLPTGEAVMGIVGGHTAKIFWIGDVNGLEEVPQPLTKNLVDWM